MKELKNKVLKYLLLVAVIISDIASPIKVLADSIDPISDSYNKGDIRVGTNISSTSGTTSVSSEGFGTDDGGVSVTKTITKKDDNGKYEVTFEIKGKDKKTTTPSAKPVYAVVVFDRSGSMEDTCIKGEWQWFSYVCVETDGKWNSAVEGAKTFATTLLSRISNAQIALVTFANSASKARDFSSINLDRANFGSPSGGTNLHAGLLEAKKLLDGVEDDDAYKYIVVISDGKPTYYYDTNGKIQGDGNSTDKKTYDTTYDTAKDIKDSEVEIFSIGYMLPKGDVYNGMTAAQILANFSSPDKAGSTFKHYMDADPEAIAGAFNNIAEEISKKNGATNAVLTDTIGSNFTVVNTTNSKGTFVTEDGVTKFVSNSIKEVTEEGTTISFEIQIDKDSVTGWHKTNDTFKLVYDDADGNEDVVLNSIEDPEVYWVQSKYDYTVNYYKDSISSDNFLNKIDGSAAKGEVITADTTLFIPDEYEFVGTAPSMIIKNGENVLNVVYTKKQYNYTINYYKDSIDNSNFLGDVKNKAAKGEVITANTTLYKPADSEYEFVGTAPSMTIKNGENVLNVVYTKKQYNYTINYYKDSIDNSNFLGKVDGTAPKDAVINAEIDLHRNTAGPGYNTGIATPSDSMTINSRENVINIVYNKIEYRYDVNYFFNEETGFSVNNNIAYYGNVINASAWHLSSSDLASHEREGYFLDPNRSSDNNGSISIPTEDEINIYYINRQNVSEEETIDKTADKTTISLENEKVTYTVKYSAKVNNVNALDEVNVVITDTLPAGINVLESDLNGGVYNSDDNTITWTFTETNEKYVESYVINKEFSYIVLYNDLVSKNNTTLTNGVTGTTTIGDVFTSDTPSDEADVKVEIYGDVTAKYVYINDDNEEVKLYTPDVEKSGLVGTDYTTERKTFFGYSLTATPSNADGKYATTKTEVKYVYTKNDSEDNITSNDVVKTGPKTVNSVNDAFRYMLTYNGTIVDYVGKATLTVVDNLPYAIDLDKSNIGSCIYDEDDLTITCTKEYNISERDYTNGVYNINEEFALSLVFVGIDSDSIVNSASGELKLEKTSVPTEADETETIVNKGTVVATYKTENGEVLSGNLSTTGLAGTEYTTIEKTFYGYSLKEVPANKAGKYLANQTITVNYVYTKNAGNVKINDVKKVQNNNIIGIDSEFNYVLSYTGEINNYVGNVTLELTDTLPYEATIISMPNECSINGKVITCSDNYTVSEENTKINAEFNIRLNYNSINSNVVTNVVNSKLIYGTEYAVGTDEVTDTIKTSSVVAEYLDEANNELVSSVIQNDLLVGTSYDTEEKTFFGYTLKETPENKSGVVTEKNIIVTYVYIKNDSEDNITSNDVVKTGPETVNSVNDAFRYMLTYNGTIVDYIGKATLTVVDNLPYAIDLDKSNIGSCIYDEDALTITCTKEYNVSERNYTNGVYNINEEFALSLVFVGIDSDSIVNTASGELKLEKTSVPTETDETETIVNKGTVIATYKDTDGNTLFADVTIGTEMGGTSYTTEEKTFFGYTLTATPSNKNGTYVANSTIYVNYIYEKNDSEENVPENNVFKVGPRIVNSINGVFDYRLIYNGTIVDYIGNVTLTIVDNLPYAIDLDKSNIGSCIYDEDALTITCTKEYNVSERNYTNGVYNINEEFELNLVFIGIDSDSIVNSASGELKLEKTDVPTDGDEFETIIKYGNVEVIYQDIDGNLLDEKVVLGEELSGTHYTTEARDFIGYVLTEMPENAEGEYVSEETITVTYVYEKVSGTGDVEELPPQTGIDGNYMFDMLLLISMIVSICYRRKRESN